MRFITNLKTIVAIGLIALGSPVYATGGGGGGGNVNTSSEAIAISEAIVRGGDNIVMGSPGGGANECRFDILGIFGGSEHDCGNTRDTIREADAIRRNCAGGYNPACDHMRNIPDVDRTFRRNGMVPGKATARAIPAGAIRVGNGWVHCNPTTRVVTRVGVSSAVAKQTCRAQAPKARSAKPAVRAASAKAPTRSARPQQQRCNCQQQTTQSSYNGF